MIGSLYSPHPRRCCRRGYTRRDVIAAAAVAAILLALATPSVLQMRGMSRRITCEARQMSLGRALLAYESEQGHFPGYRNVQAIDRDGLRRAAGWAFASFPYYAPDAGDSAFAQIYRDYGPDGPDATRGQAPSFWIENLLCPDDQPIERKRKGPWLSFVANCGMPDAPAADGAPPDWPANGVFLDRFLDPLPPDYAVSLAYLEQHDGAGATLLLSENMDARQWTDASEALIGFVWIDSLVNGQPALDERRLLAINRLAGQGDGSLRFARPSSGHAGGVNAMLCSGETRFLSQNMDYLVYARMMTSAGAEAKRPGADEPAHAAYR